MKNVEATTRKAESGRNTRRVVRMRKGDAWTIRFLPARLTDDGNFFVCAAKHWLYRRPILCLRGTDAELGGNPKVDCPVCAALEELEDHRNKDVSDFAWRVQATPQWLTFCSVIERRKGDVEPLDEILNPHIYEHYRSTIQELLGFFKSGATKRRPWSVLDYIEGNDFVVRKGRTTRLDKMDPAALIDTEDEDYMAECIKTLESHYKLPKQNIPNDHALNVFVEDIWEAAERLEEGEDAKDIEDSMSKRGKDDDDSGRGRGRDDRGRGRGRDDRDRPRASASRSPDRETDRDEDERRPSRRFDDDEERHPARAADESERRPARAADDEAPPRARQSRRELGDEDQSQERPAERRRSELPPARTRRSEPEEEDRGAAAARAEEPLEEEGKEDERAERDERREPAREPVRRPVTSARSARPAARPAARDSGRVDEDDDKDEVPPEETDSAPPAKEDDVPYDDDKGKREEGAGEEAAADDRGQAEETPAPVSPPVRRPMTRPSTAPSSVVSPTAVRLGARTGSPVPPPPAAKKPGTALLSKLGQRPPER